VGLEPSGLFGLGVGVTKKKRVERIYPDYKLLSLDIQTMCNNSCNIYHANPALLQRLGAIVLIEHDFPYPCESSDGTYLSVYFRLL
jgi:hypothetical protein